MKHLILIFIVLIAQRALSQDSKQLYQEAQSSYQLKEFEKSISTIENCQSQLGKSNAVIEHLKVRCYYELKDYENAEKALVNFFKYKAAEYLVDEMKEYASKIRKIKIEKAKIELQQSQKEVLSNFETLSNNMFTSEIRNINKEVKQIKLSLAQKENDILIEQDIQFLESLKDGYYYKIKDNKLTTSVNESSYIIFYGNKYIIITLPNKDNLYLLNTNSTNTYFKPSTNLKNESTAHIRFKRTDYYYRKSSFFDNLALGNNGEILWSGKQYESFEEELFYFLWGNSIIGDFKMPDRFNKEVYTPYFEQGTLNKEYNFNLVSKKTRERLVALGFTNSSTSSNKLKVTNGNIRAINSFFLYHKNNYTINGTNTAKYIKNGIEYKREYLICKPTFMDKGYGLKKYTHPIGYFNFLESLGDLASNNHKESKEGFDVFFENLRKNVPFRKNRFWYYLGEGSDGLYKYLNKVSKIEDNIIVKPKEYKTYYSNGNLKSVSYKDAEGKVIGLWKDYYETGELKTTYEYDNGKINGKMINYYKSGQIKSSQSLVNNRLRGESKFYNEGGTLLKDEFWVAPGEFGGYFKDFYPNGQLKNITRYNKNGKLAEWKMYFENGNIKFEAYCKDGKLMRITTNKDKNGNDLDKGTLMNGNGTVKMYDNDGNLQETNTYIDGVKQKKKD